MKSWCLCLAPIHLLWHCDTKYTCFFKASLSALYSSHVCKTVSNKIFPFRFNNKIHYDAAFISTIDFFSSIISSVVVFSVLGHLSHQLGVGVEHVAKGQSWTQSNTKYQIICFLEISWMPSPKLYYLLSTIWIPNPENWILEITNGPNTNYE